MAKFTLTHEINCDADTFWKVFFDKNFSETLYREKLGFPQYSVTEQRETDQAIQRKVSAEPKMSLPGPLVKLIGSGFRYVEDGTFDKQTKVYSYKVTPSTLADKVRHEGTVRIEPAGPGKVRRITDLTIEAKIFGVGGLMESSTEKQLREGWDQSAIYMNQWIGQGKAS